MKKQTLINQSRRNTLLGTTAGISALAVWQKPLVSSVILPAHAQMSAARIFTLSGSTDSIFPTNQSLNLLEHLPTSAINKNTVNNVANVSLSEKVLDFIVPSALAQSSSEDTVSFYLAEDANGTFTFQFYGTQTITAQDLLDDNDDLDAEDVAGFEDCLVEILIQADELVVGEEKSSIFLSCFGNGGPRIAIEIISIADDSSSATVEIDHESRVELALDPSGTEFSIQACACVQEIIDILDGPGDEEPD